MKRRGITVARIACLLLCILTVALSIRSHWRSDEWLLIYRLDGCERVSTLNGDIMIRHERPGDGKFGGVLRLTHRSDRVGALPPRPWHEDLLKTRWGLFRYINIKPASPGTFQQLAQTQAAILALQRKSPRTRAEDMALINLQMTSYRQQSALYADRYWEVVFPLWLILAAFALPVVLTGAFVAIRRHRRARRGLCRACGYDLRAGHGRCPECGAAIEHARASPVEQRGDTG